MESVTQFMLLLGIWNWSPLCWPLGEGQEDHGRAVHEPEDSGWSRYLHFQQLVLVLIKPLPQVLVATATLAWGVNFPAHLVNVKGTEYYDGKKQPSVDYFR